MKKKLTKIFFLILFIQSNAQISKLKWDKIINNQPKDWFASKEAIDVAENVLLYQRNIGGWPKNTQMQIPLSDSEKQKLQELKSDSKEITTDNKATTQEMLFLSKMYEQVKDPRYLTAFINGLNYLLEAQYPDNGGWPQFYPLKKGYYTHITYNDDSMVNIMNVLKRVIEGNYYSIKPSSETIIKAQIAFDKGINCILKTQYKQNGTLTVWCQQHDEQTLQPTNARAYELPSLCSKESARIALLLMSIVNPSPEIKKAVNAACIWFEKTKISSIREIRIPIPNSDKMEKLMIDDPDTDQVLWSRFMNLEDNKPFFCDRDGIKREGLADIGQERRIGYSWYSTEPNDALRQYEKWRRKYDN